MKSLPTGFVIDEKLPEGFVVDQPDKKATATNIPGNILAALQAGISGYGKNIAGEANTLGGEVAKGDIKSALESGIRLHTKATQPHPGMQDFVLGGIKGASLGYLQPGKEDSAQAKIGEFAGSFIPYAVAAPLGAGMRAVKGATAAARLARIGGTALPMAAVGAARPAENIQDRIKRGLLEGSIGAGFQALPELAGALGEPTRKLAAKALSVASGLPEEDVMKVLLKPGRYARKPISANEETKVMEKIKDKVVKNIDDLTSFKTQTVEDTIAHAPGVNELSVNTKKVTSAIDDYVNQMNAREITKLTKSEMGQIQALKNDLLKGKGRFGSAMRVDVAHELKKDIYREMKSAYYKPDWTDKVANAYKIGARKLNTQLRDVLPNEYALANDRLTGIYELSENIGGKGFQKLEAVGGTKKFKSLFNDPEGRQLLRKVEEILPQKDKFMHILESLEDVQRIRKSMQGTKGAMSSTIVPGLMAAGGSLGFMAGGVPGSAAGAGAGFTAGRATTTPAGIGGLATALAKLTAAKPNIRPEILPILADMLQTRGAK